MMLSLPDKANVNAKRYYVELDMLPILTEECMSLLPSSFPSRKVRLLTRQSWLKTGLPPIAMNFMAKMNGHQTRRTLTVNPHGHYKTFSS